MKIFFCALDKCLFKLLLALFFTGSFHSISALEKYPVDVCFLVVDLKYNSQQGVKICEIQQASLSSFKGDIYLSKEEESIIDHFARTLSTYHKNGWVVISSITDKKLVSTLINSSLWEHSKDALSLSPNFINQAKEPPKNIYDISSYQGFVYINPAVLNAIPDFEQMFPGMIIIDKSSFPFWIDKYKMTQLFEKNELLSSFKPKWGNYKKIYTEDLAEKIAADLQCNTFVIKPRGAFMGNGVIIVQRQDLDEVLHYIITKQGNLALSHDRAYETWKKDRFDSFIVEEFVTSDLLAVPHLENKIYQPTMRVGCLFVYNDQCPHIHFLGGYWKTPSVSLDEEGSFMEKNKDICKLPYYCAVEAKTLDLVENELRIALPLLYSQMLQFGSDSNE